MSFHTKVIDLLKTDPRFVDDEGELVIAAVQDRAWKIDRDLVKLLLSDKDIKAKFFEEIEGHWIFNTNTFIDYISQKNFLDNSYTRFRNRIGLTIGDKYLRERGDVALVWPYKDTVLEGGQTKEEEKRKEIFFNEMLAQDEINRLLDPKVLTNFARYTAKGKEKATGFKRDENGVIRENLSVKGNNLLALHTLKQQFSGQIKLIYIDQPYNTGNDSFGYNDSFNHSSWLTFMKNRLEVAKELLRDDGVIFVSLDDSESHYCKLLMDEVFDRENFICTIIWHSKYTVSNDAKYVSYQHENILFFAKNKNAFQIGLLERTDEQNAAYRNPDNDPKGPWKATPLHAKSGKEENNYTIRFPNGSEWSPPKGRYPRYSKERLLKIYHEGGLYFNKNGGVDKKTYLSEVKQGVTIGSVWSYDEVGHTHGNNEELAEILGKGAFNNPKGTALLKKIIKVANVSNNDIVLDYHAGSGTTAHAVLETNKEMDDGDVKFILCEQMDYAESVTAKRVRKVMEENKNGDFIYCELMEYNEAFMERIQTAKSSKELLKTWQEMAEGSFLNWYVNPAMPEEAAKDFEAIGKEENGLEKQKHLLAELLDKNQLYVNLSEIDDAQFKVSKEDKALNKAFYGEAYNA